MQPTALNKKATVLSYRVPVVVVVLRAGKVGGWGAGGAEGGVGGSEGRSLAGSVDMN